MYKLRQMAYSMILFLCFKGVVMWELVFVCTECDADMIYKWDLGFFRGGYFPELTTVCIYVRTCVCTVYASCAVCMVWTSCTYVLAYMLLLIVSQICMYVCECCDADMYILLFCCRQSTKLLSTTSVGRISVTLWFPTSHQWRSPSFTDQHHVSLHRHHPSQHLSAKPVPIQLRQLHPRNPLWADLLLRWWRRESN